MYRSRLYARDRYPHDEKGRYNQEERYPKRHEGHGPSEAPYASPSNSQNVKCKKESDSFWDSKWEAMELQKKADKQDKKGKHFLDDEIKRTKENQKTDSTPSLSPERSPSPECEELRRINKMKEIQVNFINPYYLEVNTGDKYIKLLISNLTIYCTLCRAS